MVDFGDVADARKVSSHIALRFLTEGCVEREGDDMVQGRKGGRDWINAVDARWSMAMWHLSCRKIRTWGPG